MTSHLALTTVILALSIVIARGDVSDYTKCCRCDNLMPEYVPNGIKPQKVPSPFRIIVKENSYTINEEVHVNLTATSLDKYRSFALVAYTVSSTGNSRRQAVGELTLLDKGYSVDQACFSTDVTGRRSYVLFGGESKGVQNLRFVWKPTAYYGHIEFRATFVKTDKTFWVAEKSRTIYDDSIGIPPHQRLFTPIINTQQCGKSKGCFRHPSGCTEPQCLYILTWTSDAQKVNFELGGLTDGSADSFVAFGLSDDTYVGDDTVFVCAHDSATDSTEVYLGNHNDDYETNTIKKYNVLKNGKVDRTMNFYKSVIVKEQGSYSNNRLQCIFTVNRDLKYFDSKLKSLRSGANHLILSHGYADRGEPKLLGVGHDEYPYISEYKVKFDTYSDSEGRATYPLVKAHGCLMVIAWVLFSSVGFLLAKYYQPMWPEKRMHEKKYWFMGHFQCMSMVFILVIISVILIFIEGDGYTKADVLPYKAHPILGIIILICVLIMPFVGLLRPAPGDRCRPVFNWLYWIFATIANVLAIPNIFIGMDFGKSMVPWWATWILVIWVIFHIIVEITLEVHQCMTHKKNKERRKKHELLKRDYPKQHHPVPEPAGRRFKRCMLMLHLAVTIVIVLIMVIVIAVSS